MITPKKLHEWYLEACKELSPENFNTDAQKPYEELSEEQKFIDIYIAEKIKRKLKKEIEKFEEQLIENFGWTKAEHSQLRSQLGRKFSILKQNLGIGDDSN